jgi:hypothetical protein
MIWKPSHRNPGRKPNASGTTSKPPRPRQSIRPSEQRKKREMTPSLARKKRKRMSLPSMEEEIPVLKRRKALSLPMLRR